MTTGRLPMFTKKIAAKADHYQTLPLAEYLDVLQGDYAENDPAIWLTFFAYKSQFPDLAAIEETTVHLFLGQYGFYLDPFDAERDGLNWVLSTSIVDFPIHASFKNFQKDLPLLFTEIENAALPKPILTDSFMFADGFADSAALAGSGIIALNSPVAEIKPTFTAYLESLTSERRKKFRRAEEELSEFNLRFDLSNQPLSDAEFTFIVDNLKKKWGDDYLYALCQTLWSIAVAKHRPQQAYIMRVYDADRLVFLQTMLARGQNMVCQSIVKNEETHYNGIAAFTDFQCVKALCGSNFLHFDPSCRTGLNDPESIGIAKRATVNKNTVKPIFAAGKSLPENISTIIKEKIVQGKPA
jgi:hypothetical protein